MNRFYHLIISGILALNLIIITPFSITWSQESSLPTLPTLPSITLPKQSTIAKEGDTTNISKAPFQTSKVEKIYQPQKEMNFNSDQVTNKLNDKDTNIKDNDQNEDTKNSIPPETTDNEIQNIDLDIKKEEKDSQILQNSISQSSAIEKTEPDDDLTKQPHISDTIVDSSVKSTSNVISNGIDDTNKAKQSDIPILSHGKNDPPPLPKVIIPDEETDNLSNDDQDHSQENSSNKSTSAVEDMTIPDLNNNPNYDMEVNKEKNNDISYINKNQKFNNDDNNWKIQKNDSKISKSNNSNDNYIKDNSKEIKLEKVKIKESKVKSDQGNKEKLEAKKKQVTPKKDKSVTNELPEFTLPDDDTVAVIEDFQPEVFPRPTYNYRQNVLPNAISKKKYSEQNSALPKAFYQSEYSSLLFAATKMDDILSIKALLERGADINFHDPKSGYTPLIYAIIMNKITSMRYLITRGAAINAKDRDGKTAMHFAALNSNIEAMQVLISAGANITLKDIFDKSAADYLMKAPVATILELVGSYSDMKKAMLDFSKVGNREAVQYAIAHGANPNARDPNSGDTPMIMAIKQGNIEMLSMLIIYGADINKTDINNLSPLQIALTKGNNEIINIIRTVIIQNEFQRIDNAKKSRKLVDKDDISKSGIKRNQNHTSKNQQYIIDSGYDIKQYPSQKPLSLP